MWYAYDNEKHVGIANSIAKERLAEEHPDWQWLSHEEHLEKQAMPSDRDIFSSFLVLASCAGVLILIISALLTK